MATEAGKAYVSVEFDPNSMRNLSTQVRSQQGGLTRSLGGIGRTAGLALGAGVAGAAGYAIFKGFSFAKSAVIDFNSQLQQSKVAFTTLLGSQKLATQAQGQLIEFARKTPFELEQILPVAQQLLGTGTKLRDLTPIMTKLGDAISATGGSSAQLDLLTTAYTQVTTAGTAHLQDLMQINNAVPGSMSKIAAAMGLTIGKFREAVSAGKVSSEEANTAILKAFGAKGFGGAMEAQSKTFSGAMSNVHDSLQILIATAGRPLFNAISQGANAFGTWLTNSKQATAVAKSLSHTLGDLVKGAVGFVKGLGSGDQGAAIIDTLKTIASVVMDAVMPAFKMIGTEVVPLVGQLLAALQPITPFLTNVLEPILKGVLVGVLGTVIGVLKILIPVVRIVAVTLGWLGKQAKPLRPVLYAVGVVLGMLASGPILKAIVGVGKLGTVFGWLSRLVPKALGTVLGWFPKISGGFTRMVGMVLGAAARLAGSLVSRFTGIQQRVVVWAVELGANIIRGIVEGIARHAGDIANALTGAVGNAKDRVLGALGISSPSKVFAQEVGQPISQGIAQGIRDHAKHVRGAMAAATQPPGVAGGGAGGRGRLSLVITNWEEGTGYIEHLASGEVMGAGALASQRARMRR